MYMYICMNIYTCRMPFLIICCNFTRVYFETATHNYYFHESFLGTTAHTQ